MKDKLTTYGLDPEKVVELLSLGKDTGSTSTDINQHKSDLICEKLKETVPFFFSTEQKPSQKLHRLRHTIAILSGEPIGKLLQNPKTDIDLIRMIKDYGRKLACCSESEAEQHASRTIYYAAIAHALVFHNFKITNFSYENLKDSFAHLLQEKWIPKSLLNLFEKALVICKEKKK